MELEPEDLHEIDVNARRYVLFKWNCYNADKNDLLGPVKAGVLSYIDIYYLGLVECCMDYIQKRNIRQKIYPEDTYDLVSIITGMTPKDFREKNVEIINKLGIYATGKKNEGQK